MTRPIVLCADDYAHTPAISRAILDLATRKRISAVSCMTASRHWPIHGPWLQAVCDNVDIGLHLTLVDESPITAMHHTAPAGRLPTVGALIAKSYLSGLSLDEIEAEIRAQVTAFEKVMGFSPQHIDGHLHTHVLPGIRERVLKVAREMSPRPWLRNITEPFSALIQRRARPKAAFLALLGKPLARTTDMAMNEGFSGLYGFSAAEAPYERLFDKFLASTGRRHLILCHPGEAGDDAAHTRARADEYAFFKGDAFPAMLARRNLRVGRFAETAP